MYIKVLTVEDERLLLDFLQWLTPKALDLWHYYGRKFDTKIVNGILSDFSSIKLALIEGYTIVAFGHLYNFTEHTCRLGIVSAVVGRGYGTKLMCELIKYAKNMGCNEIHLSTYADNEKAITLYERFGFIVTNEFTDRPRKKLELKLKI
jgi:ribosomal protein S18 acetylase RimI-like enzyme